MNIATPNEILNSRINWIVQQADVQDLIKLLSREVILSKSEQINNGIRYLFFNNQPEQLADFNSQLDAAADIVDKLNFINNVTSSDLFVISNGSVGLQTDALKLLVLSAVSNVFDRQLPNRNNVAVLAFIERDLNKNIGDLAEHLQPVTLELLRQSASDHPLGRSRRDISSTITGIFRSILQVAITQVQNLFDAFMQSITTAVTNLYIGDQQTNLILSTVAKYANQVILQITQLLVNIQQWGDTLINSVISQSSRRRREIESLDVYWDIESPASDLVNCRSKRDIFSTVGAGIAGLFQLIMNAFNPLVIFMNRTLKNVFISFVELQYVAVGRFVLFPARLLFEIIVDTVFPCTTCGSIV